MNILKKQIIKIVAAGFMLSVILVACIEDKGNYEYKDINDITISGIDSIYTVAMGSQLRINPVLEFSVSEAQDEYEYGWYILNPLNFYMAGPALSRERNLDIFIVNPASSTPYWLLFCVTNQTTGVRYEFRFRLYVLDKMQNGYILLHETENNFDLDLISEFRDTLTQYHRVLDLFNSELPRDGRKAIDLVCYRCQLSPIIGFSGKRYAIWILTDNGTDRVRVSDYGWEPNYNISGISSIPDRYLKGDPLVAEKMHAPMGPWTSGSNWIYFKGDWYWYHLTQMAYFYMQPINAPAPELPPYKAAPFIFAREGNNAVLFNEDDNRFEYQSINPLQGSNVNLLTRRLGAGEEMFNWENPDYSLIYMDNRTMADGFAIVRNRATNRYELLLMRSSGSGPTQKIGYGVFPTDLVLEDMKFFAFHSSLPYLFCATEDAVYRINTNAMQRWERVPDRDILPPGHKISKMRSTALGFSRTSLIALCTYAPEGEPGQNGRLAIYNVMDGTGTLMLAKHPPTPTDDGYQIDMEWTGFGKIINVHYKDVP